MPPGCCKPDFDALFDEPMAYGDLEDYRRKGATGPTRQLLDALHAEGVEGATLLDIGAGVGIIGHELLASGAAHFTDVDASRAYLAVAREEAERRGTTDRADFRYGDFVELAHDIDPADIVTLDRVLCCYRDWNALVAASVARARRSYGLIYPLDRPWWRAAAAFGNLALWLGRSTFRFHVHSERAIDLTVRAAGFERAVRRRGIIWQMVLYRRVA